MFLKIFKKGVINRDQNNLSELPLWAVQHGRREATDRTELSLLFVEEMGSPSGTVKE